MEDKRNTMTNRQGWKKIHPLFSNLSIGGEGGIAGLFVFGGALAIAGFMAVTSFASNKHKAQGTHDHQPKPKPKPKQVLLEEHGCKSEEDHDTAQSLTSLIQHSTIQHEDATCCWTSNKVNDTSQLLSARSLILVEEEKGSDDELRETNVEESGSGGVQHQEIALSDFSHPGSAASSNESGVGEECMMLLFNRQGGEAQEVENDIQESQDDIITSSESDDDVSKAIGLGEEAELIQQNGNKQKNKGTSADRHVCHRDSDVDESDMDEAMPLPRQNLNLFLVPNNQPYTWLLPFFLLALLLILVLLTRHPQESFILLDEGNSIVKPI